jgi:dolichol-phosphate mannosyltransferase
VTDRVLVIIPTYNETANIERIVGRVRAAHPAVDVLVVDDASPDGTGEIADRLAAADGQVHVLHRPGKQGIGVAYIAGFRWGLERDYDVLVEMDADGSHQPEELHRLLGALAEPAAGAAAAASTGPGPDGGGGADLALGSRWVPGGQVLNWPASRKILSRGGNTYARLALAIPLQDATGGYRAFRRKVLESIGLEDVASQGYCFQVDLAWRALRSGFRVVEVPITFVEREHGASKMSRSIVTEALWRITVWGARHRGLALVGHIRTSRGRPANYGRR